MEAVRSRHEGGRVQALPALKKGNKQGALQMEELTVIEIKAFVPARDLSLSKQFYEDLGFTVAWSSDDLAYVRHGKASFLLQKFYVPEHAGNFMMHLLLE